MSSNETKVMLDNNNYTLWLIPIEAKLYKIKALNIVTGAVTCPDPEKDKDNARLFVKLNEDAYAEIVQHLSPEVLAYVSSSLSTDEKFNGFKLWQLLKAKFSGDEITSKTTALKNENDLDARQTPSRLPLV
ncbi:hypothetical protein VP01_10865g1 [Puccinia sorghi]|uniref:Uncharacterized protein n=1 Tax=Puccinia sorghi TaxID=27349 RepID=A0A0L6VT86_9BASI|nr:hypothetical protein VP01_10865g1 [Puccinia sorghi]